MTILVKHFQKLPQHPHDCSSFYSAIKPLLIKVMKNHRGFFKFSLQGKTLISGVKKNVKIVYFE